MKLGSKKPLEFRKRNRDIPVNFFAIPAATNLIPHVTSLAVMSVLHSALERDRTQAGSAQHPEHRPARVISESTHSKILLFILGA